MKNLLIWFSLTLGLWFFTYALMVGAISLPGPVPVRVNDDTPLRSPEPASATSSVAAVGNRLSSEAMNNIIDCYAGKPVFLDAAQSRPLYPSCDHLLRIYQSKTTEADQVLTLLAKAQKEHQ